MNYFGFPLKDKYESEFEEFSDLEKNLSAYGVEFELFPDILNYIRYHGFNYIDFNSRLISRNHKSNDNGLIIGGGDDEELDFI